MKDVLKEKVGYLELSDDINKVLTKNNIKTVDDLWHQNRKDLKKIGLTDKDITAIIIKMELNALDLGGKRY